MAKLPCSVDILLATYVSNSKNEGLLNYAIGRQRGSDDSTAW